MGGLGIRNRRLTLPILAVTIAAGLLSRHWQLHGPLWVRKDPGDVLWGAMVYWLVALIAYRLPAVRVAIIAAAYASATEVFKLYNPPAIDHLRHTFAGHLVLGQVFSWRDLACYAVGIGLSAAVDLALADR